MNKLVTQGRGRGRPVSFNQGRFQEWGQGSQPVRPSLFGRTSNVHITTIYECRNYYHFIPYPPARKSEICVSLLVLAFHIEGKVRWMEGEVVGRKGRWSEGRGGGWMKGEVVG